MWCKICGGEIYPEIESINGTHADADYCVVILNARVEHELTRAEAAERRLAELEARLAEQEWRPVTEKPIEPGTYLVYDADGEPYLFAGVWPYRVARWDNGWGSGLDGLVDYWRPLPAPPIDPPAPA